MRESLPSRHAWFETPACAAIHWRFQNARSELTPTPHTAAVAPLHCWRKSRETAPKENSTRQSRISYFSSASTTPSLGLSSIMSGLVSIIWPNWKPAYRIYHEKQVGEVLSQLESFPRSSFPRRSRKVRHRIFPSAPGPLHQQERQGRRSQRMSTPIQTSLRFCVLLRRH